jgi:hypothetical protein
MGCQASHPARSNAATPVAPDDARDAKLALKRSRLVRAGAAPTSTDYLKLVCFPITLGEDP